MIKPISVQTMDGYMLKIAFDNGEFRLFDLKPYLEMPFYFPLKDITQFKQVYVSEYTIEWKNGRNIAPHELYEYSIPYIREVKRLIRIVK